MAATDLSANAVRRRGLCGPVLRMRRPDGPCLDEETKTGPLRCISGCHSGDRRLRLLNDEPGDTLNANEFWKAIVRDYYLGKGGYAYIHRQGGEVVSLHYVQEQEISVLKSPDPIFKDFDL